jgi:hypothetical protein
MRLPFLNRRISPLFPISFITLLLLLLLLIFVPPSAQVTLPFVALTAVVFFLLLVFLLCFAIGTLAFTSRFHGFLLASCVLAALLLRLSGLKHPLFIVLVIALFITLEFFFSQSTSKKPVSSSRRDRAQKES